MFQRFTQRARQAVVAAQDDARALGCDHITPDHLLLGLIAIEDGLAGRVLAALGVPDRAGVRAQLAPGPGSPQGQIPFSPQAKKALELALREALSLGHNHIGTEHILLGLARVGEGITSQLLPEEATVRDKVIELLGPHAVGIPPRRRSFFARSAQIQWEYRVERRDEIDADWLNELGAEGWELVDVSGGTFVFKRRRQLGSLRAAG
jgi:ATP-dependent Clp protease ATP-binding subunit ClpA